MWVKGTQEVGQRMLLARTDDEEMDINLNLN